MNRPSEAPLRERMDYEPVPLRFGTSGRRGLVTDLTQLEVYTNARAELQYLQSLSKTEGGIIRGEEFFFACDLRPSSSQVVPGQPARGGLAQAVVQAITDAGMNPVYLGRIPTPALAYYAFCAGRGSMMITGSHIPFDRNGYKTNTAKGELLKRDEAPIQTIVEQVRARLYAEPASASPFEACGQYSGMFKDRQRSLPPEDSTAARTYLERYTDFFGEGCLTGLRLLVYQHSAVGRDLLVELLQACGATVIPAGRSESFVPIDTEAIDDDQLRVVHSLAAAGWREHGPIDAVVSTDGDSDRPLILAVEPASTQGAAKPCRVRFFSGDLVGMLVAEYLQADAVVVPISCNDAVDKGVLKPSLEPKTRIGSPFVIAGMQGAAAKGRKAICGWEANGGFLLGSDFTRNRRMLKALPTRDAFLPILTVLLSAKEKGLSLSALFDGLPRRFSKSVLLRNFPRPASRRIVDRFTPADDRIRTVSFTERVLLVQDASGEQVTPVAPVVAELERIRKDLEPFFKPESGFGQIVALDYTDGVRMTFSNRDVAHVRPSGNADELRLYAVADTQERADAIGADGIAEPDGILRQLERFAAS